jgi:hypothetical protein
VTNSDCAIGKWHNDCLGMKEEDITPDGEPFFCSDGCSQMRVRQEGAIANLADR